jgi:hypothetical protein
MLGAPSSKFGYQHGLAGLLKARADAGWLSVSVEQRRPILESLVNDFGRSVRRFDPGPQFGGPSVYFHLKTIEALSCHRPQWMPSQTTRSSTTSTPRWPVADSTDTTWRASMARMPSGSRARYRPAGPARWRTASAAPPCWRSGSAGWSPAHGGYGSAHPGRHGEQQRVARTGPGGRHGAWRGPGGTRSPRRGRPHQVLGPPELPGARAVLARPVLAVLPRPGRPALGSARPSTPCGGSG